MSNILHSTLGGLDLHEDKRIKQPVRAASNGNVTITGPGTAIDGVTLVNGDRVLLKDQTTAAQNGIYVWNGSSSSMTRATDATNPADFVFGFKVYVREGTIYGATYWTFTTSATSLTVGTTALAFAEDAPAIGNQNANTVYAGPTSGTATAPGFRALVSADLPSSPIFSGEVSAVDVKVVGLSGTGAAMRIVGATTSGAPVSGTFSVGDVVLDLTGKWWICTGAGTPGTWTQASGSMNNPMTTNQDLILGGANGTPGRLAIGANGQVLGINGGIVGWTNNPSGFTNPMTQIGDMVVGTTAGAALRLAVGANGQVLTVVGGQPGWANPSGGVGGAGNNAASNLFLATACI